MTIVDGAAFRLIELNRVNCDLTNPLAAVTQIGPRDVIDSFPNVFGDYVDGVLVFVIVCFVVEQAVEQEQRSVKLDDEGSREVPEVSVPNGKPVCVALGVI